MQGRGKAESDPLSISTCSFCAVSHSTTDQSHLKSVTWGQDAGRDKLCFLQLFRVSCSGFFVRFSFAPPLVWLAKATIWKSGDSPVWIAEPMFRSPINKHPTTTALSFWKSPHPFQSIYSQSISETISRASLAQISDLLHCNHQLQVSASLHCF